MTTRAQPSPLPTRPLLLSMAAFAALFLGYPELDLLAAGLFYSPDGGFVLRGQPFFDALHKYIGVLAWSIALGAVLLWLHDRYRRGADIPAGRRRAAAFVLFALLLGPGLVVNTILKDQWGRARPGYVAEFGGPAVFTPALLPTNQCRKNCSFVCGDASVGFGLVAFAFVGRRRLWLTLGIGIGAALGLMRMGQGGHFLSDVVFSFYAVYFTAWLLRRLAFRNGFTAPTA